MRFKKTLITIISGAIVIGTSLNLYRIFELKQDYNILTQEYSQAIEDVNQLTQNYKEEKQESQKTIRQLNQDYAKLQEENIQLKEKSSQLEKEISQLKQQSQESSKKLEVLIEEHAKLKEENVLLNQEYQTVADENEQLKSQQEELRKKEKQTLEELTKGHVSLIKYSSEYGFPNYKIGLINKQDNWMSDDTLNNHGWQIINKKSTSTLTSPNNILTFLPSSAFTTFSSEDNYATLHLKAEKPIKTFIVGGEYNIKKNGYLNISISSDNKNWTAIEVFNSRNQNNYKFGYFTQYNRGHFPELKIDKDLFIRHSAGTLSNKNYEVEIWRLSAYINTE